MSASGKKPSSSQLSIRIGLVIVLINWTIARGGGLYQCDSTYCDDAMDECMCARGSPPGELSPENVPQFILITADNAITTYTEYAMRQVTSAHKNSNGCNIPATWFTGVDNSDASLIRQLYLDGYEIGTKTVSHQADPSVEEVVDAREWVSYNAGIPQDAVNGFRTPYLKHSNHTRKILHDFGFRYDSSITERFGSWESQTSETADQRLWPYTMDYGIPQNCESGSGSCEDDERWPGLWEVPMWVTQDEQGYAIAAMDPTSSYESVYDIYKREFYRNYNGNRAPVGIFVHPAWLLADQGNVKNLNSLLKDVLQNNHTFVVTVNQLLDWMNDPVDAESFRENFTSEVQCPESGYMPAWNGIRGENKGQTTVQSTTGTQATTEPNTQTSDGAETATNASDESTFTGDESGGGWQDGETDQGWKTGEDNGGTQESEFYSEPYDQFEEENDLATEQHLTTDAPQNFAYDESTDASASESSNVLEVDIYSSNAGRSYADRSYADRSYAGNSNAGRSNADSSNADSADTDSSDMDSTDGSHRNKRDYGEGGYYEDMSSDSYTRTARLSYETSHAAKKLLLAWFWVAMFGLACLVLGGLLLNGHLGRQEDLREHLVRMGHAPKNNDSTDGHPYLNGSRDGGTDEKIDDGIIL